jgi:hypothetical protein
VASPTHLCSLVSFHRQPSDRTARVVLSLHVARILSDADINSIKNNYNKHNRPSTVDSRKAPRGTQ